MLHYYNLSAVGVHQLNHGRMLSIGCAPGQGRVGGWWEITQLSRVTACCPQPDPRAPAPSAERVCRSVELAGSSGGTNEEISKSFQISKSWNE